MEITAIALQTVAENQNVLFTETVTSGNCSIIHREGSGITTLRGTTNQCRARYKVSFGGNIAIPTGGTVEAISLAIAINGEAIGTTTMIYTPAAVEEFGNVFSAIFLDVPRDCCLSASVKNISTQPVNVQNANLIIERVA
jgi:hypothetical protein